MPLLSHRCSGQSNGRKEIAERWICALLFLQFLLLFVKINKNQRAERGRKHLNWGACPAATRCNHAVTLPAKSRSDLNNWREESGKRGPIPRTHDLQEKAGFQNKACNVRPSAWSLRQQDPAIPMSLGKNLDQPHPKRIIATTASHTAVPRKAPPPCEHPLHTVHQEGTTMEKCRKMSK